MLVTCISELKTSHVTFYKGQTYTANRINEHWWLVDSVGITPENFDQHFEEYKEKKVIEDSVEEKIDYGKKDI